MEMKNSNVSRRHFFYMAICTGFLHRKGGPCCDLSLLLPVFAGAEVSDQALAPQSGPLSPREGGRKAHCSLLPRPLCPSHPARPQPRALASVPPAEPSPQTRPWWRKVSRLKEGLCSQNLKVNRWIPFPQEHGRSPLLGPITPSTWSYNVRGALRADITDCALRNSFHQAVSKTKLNSSDLRSTDLGNTSLGTPPPPSLQHTLAEQAS